MNYSAIVNGQITKRPVQSWRDWFYVIFGGAYNDLINDIHQHVHGVTAQVFQRFSQPCQTEPAVLKAIKASIIDVLPECQKVKGFIDAIEAIETEKLKWENWSDLLDPAFLIEALAWAVYSVAFKIWNFLEASQKTGEIRGAFQQMSQTIHRAGMEQRIDQNGNLRIQIAVGNYESDAEKRAVSISLSSQGGQDKTFMPVVEIHVERESDQSELLLKAERLFWQGSNANYPIQESVLFGPDCQRHLDRFCVFDVKELVEYGLCVTFDASDHGQEAEQIGMAMAFQLAVREGADRLVISTKSTTDFSSFGFKKYQNPSLNPEEDIHLWRVDQSEISYNYGNLRGLPQFFGFLPENKTFFPKKELLAPKQHSTP